MPKDIVLSSNLAKDFIKKGTKTKKGGLGTGGIYRKKSDHRDYMVKLTSGYHTPGQNNAFRSYQEVLASRLAIACGVAVPKMYEVINSNPSHPTAEIYVASEIIQHSKDFSADQIKQQLQDPNKKNQNIDFLSNCVIHAWLCNRDLVNQVGANFVKDQDGRIYNVDLGNCLLSGFRGRSNHIEPDQINFIHEDPVKLIPFLDTTNPNKFKLKAADHTDIEIKNKTQLSKLTIEDQELQKSCFLQGLLKIMAISDEELSAIVDSSGDTPANKQDIIYGLQIRRQKLIEYANDTYGSNALEEEDLALNIQKIMHQACVFPECPITTGDAKVSWYAQIQNASKPNVIIDYDYDDQNPSLTKYTYTCTYANATQAQQALEVFKKLDFNNIKIENNVITIINENRFELPYNLSKNIIADKLQILLGSYGKKQTANYNTPYPYTHKPNSSKGINKDGLRPIVTINNTSPHLIIEFDRNQISAEEFKQLLSKTYDLTITDFATLTPDTGDKIIITDPNKFIRSVTTNIGARKTAIVSENEQGQVLAGQLDPTKKGGKKGFATAGGNSDLPMNPQKAAAQEAGDEFGYKISNHNALQPIGSTVTNNVSNIFLAPPKITSTSQSPIGYKEFQEGTIKWYSFNEFRQVYNKTKFSKSYKDIIKFDRSSIEYYVKYYQREIQKQLQELGLNNFIVICSKKPETLGQIYIKPSISNDQKHTTLITLEQEGLLNNILRQRGIHFTTEEKKSLIKKATKDKLAEYINRKIIKIDEDLNPAIFLQKLKTPIIKQNLTFDHDSHISTIPTVSDNKIHRYTMPFNNQNPKQSQYFKYNIQYQATQMLSNFQAILKINPSAKIAITYSANNEQALEITDGYKTGNYNIDGGNQAAVFNQFIKLLNATPNAKQLKNQIHILPIATSMKAGGDGAVTEQEIKRDMTNIAKHLGAGWTILGLCNQQTAANTYAIGGGNSEKIWQGLLKETCDHALQKMTNCDISTLMPGDKHYYLKTAYDEGYKNPKQLLTPQIRTRQIPQPTVTTNQDLIKNIDWSKEFQHDDFKFLQVANEKSDPHYIGSITNNKNPTDPLVNITTNSLKCPLNNQQLKPKQPEAMVTALQLIIQKNNKNFKNPLTIKANHFTAEHLSEIMIILKNRNTPVFFQIDKNNPKDIKQLINDYNRDQFLKKHGDSHEDYDWLDAGAGGNCLFLSIAHQLNARNIEKTDHQTVRNNIADYINENWDKFKEFIDEEYTKKAGLGNKGGAALTEEEKATYIDQLKKDGYWGDNLSIKAAAELFNINIIVKSKQDKQHDHIEPAVDPNNPKGTIYIGHISELHYQSLFLKDQKTLATTSSTKPSAGL